MAHGSRQDVGSKLTKLMEEQKFVSKEEDLSWDEEENECEEKGFNDL